MTSDYDELRLFALLKWRFGGPNGILTFLGRPGGNPDGPFKWDFLFVPCGELKLHIIRSVQGIELQWWGADTTGTSIIKYLDYNIQKYTSQIEDEAKKLEPYTLILNPYIRHRAIARSALDELKAIKLNEPSLPPMVGAKKEDLEDYTERFKSYMNLVQRQASYNFLLVLESAFMAESYLNLMLALLLRDEVKMSQSILTETLMRKWKSKIERLPIDCKYIKGQPDLGDCRVRDAKIMFDLRNRLAHSYPDKKDLKLGEMWFFQSFPVLPKAVPFHKFALALHNQLPSIDEAIFCMGAAEGLINLLTDLIDDRIVEDFKHFTESNPLGFNEHKQIYGVPFAGEFIFFLAMGS